MRRVAQLFTGLTLMSACVLAPAAAFAQEAQPPCDAYSQACPTIPGQPIQGDTPGQPAQGGGTVEQPVQVGGGAGDQPVQGGGTVNTPIQGGGGGAAELPATGVSGAGTQAGGAVTQTGGAGTGSASTLPFTGADVVLLTLIGAGALAAGAAMVTAGRRRRTATA